MECFLFKVLVSGYTTGLAWLCVESGQGSVEKVNECSVVPGKTRHFTRRCPILFNVQVKDWKRISNIATVVDHNFFDSLLPKN